MAVVATPLRPHVNCYWVVPALFLAGEYPGAFRPDSARARLLAHIDAGVTHFLDLTHPRDGLEPYADLLPELTSQTERLVHYQRQPIYDMSTPTPAEMVTILDIIDQTLANKGVLYLHCWGGIGRTGTVVGCYLVRHGLTGDEALAQLATWWQTVEKASRSPRSPETDAQVAMVQDWQRGM